MARVVIITDFAGERGFTRPAGPYRIATELRKAGYSTQVIDHFTDICRDSIMPMKALIDKFVDGDTLMVGLSTTFFVQVRAPEEVKKRLKKHAYYGQPTLGHPLSDEEMLEIFSWIKQRSPKCKIVLGGAKAGYKEAVGVDAFVVGYADDAVIKLVKYLDGKNPFFQFKRFNGAMLINDDMKAANFDFNHSQIRWDETDLIRRGEALPMEIARGCIFRCKFCAYPLNGKKKIDYIKDPAILIDEFQRNYDLYGTTQYIYGDDTHNDSTYKLETLYNQVYSKLSFKVNFYTYLRLDLLAAHPEQIELLHASGLKSCFFGIETLNEASAKAIGKGIKPEKVKETLKKCREVWKRDVTMQSGIIIGLPHDSEDTVRDWCDWLVGPENPLDGMSFQALLMRPNSRNEWKSEIELNYQKYGYRFPEGAYGPNNWYNVETGLSYERAHELREEYIYRVPPKNAKISSFAVPCYYNIGYSIKDMLVKPMKEVLKGTDPVARKNRIVDEYYQKLLAL